MSKIITKLLVKEIVNCVDCPHMSPCHTDPSNWDKSPIALICSHEQTIWARTVAWSNRRVDTEETLIPEWCPLEDAKVN